VSRKTQRLRTTWGTTSLTEVVPRALSQWRVVAEFDPSSTDPSMPGASPSLGEMCEQRPYAMSRPKGGVLCRPRRERECRLDPKPWRERPRDRARLCPGATRQGRSRHGLAVGCQRGRRRVVMVATALAIIWQQRVVHDAWRPATARESMALCSAPSSLLAPLRPRVPRGCGH